MDGWFCSPLISWLTNLHREYQTNYDHEMRKSWFGLLPTSARYDKRCLQLPKDPKWPPGLELAKEDMMMTSISTWQRIFLQFESLRLLPTNLKAAKLDKYTEATLRKNKRHATKDSLHQPPRMGVDGSTGGRIGWNTSFLWTQTWDGTALRSSSPWMMLHYFHLGLCGKVYIQGHTIRVSMKQSNKKEFHGVKKWGEITKLGRTHFFHPRQLNFLSPCEAKTITLNHKHYAPKTNQVKHPETQGACDSVVISDGLGWEHVGLHVCPFFDTSARRVKNKGKLREKRSTSSLSEVLRSAR